MTSRTGHARLAGGRYSDTTTANQRWKIVAAR
jgi:hypothetical protein